MNHKIVALNCHGISQIVVECLPEKVDENLLILDKENSILAAVVFDAKNVVIGTFGNPDIVADHLSTRTARE